MADTFLTGIEIKKVRHLQNISIPLSTEKRKHLILTGKNGSGKTSVLEQLKENLEYLVSDGFQFCSEIERMVNFYKDMLEKEGESDAIKSQKESARRSLSNWQNNLLAWTDGVVAQCDYMALREKYKEGNFIIAYYKATRFSKVEMSNTIEHIELKDQYQIKDTPGIKLIKYMVGLKATQAFALQKKDMKRVEEIENWFQRFESILKRIFEDPSLKLDFDIENFRFSIIQRNREPFDFNTLSSGYAAVFDIINDLIMRVEKKGDNTEGIVLIDEVDLHLHPAWQHRILSDLREIFPRVQFVVTTHAPAVISSVKSENLVVLDDYEVRDVTSEIYGNDINSILTGVMGVSDRNPKIAKLFDQFYSFLNNGQYDEAEDILDEIDQQREYHDKEVAAGRVKLKLERIRGGKK